MGEFNIQFLDRLEEGLHPAEEMKNEDEEQKSPEHNIEPPPVMERKYSGLDSSPAKINLESIPNIKQRAESELSMKSPGIKARRQLFDSKNSIFQNFFGELIEGVLYKNPENDQDVQ